MDSEVQRGPGAERIPAVEAPYGERTAELLGTMMPPGSPVEPLRLFRVFVRNAPLASAMRGFGSYALGRRLSVSREDREVVILRVCGRCGCEYEWGVHAASWADRVHLDPEHLHASVSAGSEHEAWSPRQRLLVRLVDELHDTSTVSDELWRELSERWSPEQLLDLVVLTGWYHAIAFVANAARTTPEEWAHRFP